MTPAQRVTFILHDVFAYPFTDVAQIVGRTPAACRQLATSARRRIRAAQAPATPTARQARIVRDFKQAWEAKDINALIGLLDPDATATGDGGGLVSAAPRPIEGGEQIARYMGDPASPAWWLSKTASPSPCTRSTSLATGSSTSGPYSTPTSSGPGRQARTTS
jgi:RNA polymerase sigma-70 factor (ECF subfamily)